MDGGTAVSVPVMTATNSTSKSLANYAIPKLEAETLTAQSASIANISSATYTSQGFITSLSGALTLAH